MGWTWRAGGRLLLQYPDLANNAELIERWPSLRALRDEMVESGALKQDTDGRVSISETSQQSGE